MKFVIDVPFHIASFIGRWDRLSVLLTTQATMLPYDWLIFKSCICEAHRCIIIGIIIIIIIIIIIVIIVIIVIIIVIIIISDTSKSKL